MPALFYLFEMIAAEALLILQECFLFDLEALDVSVKAWAMDGLLAELPLALQHLQQYLGAGLAATLLFFLLQHGLSSRPSFCSGSSLMESMMGSRAWMVSQRLPLDASAADDQAVDAILSSQLPFVLGPALAGS